MAQDDGFTTGEQAVEFLRDRAVYPPRETLGSDIDMVMKGGITSGVVYPLAICELARKHGFRNLGGSSAGGIAAAMAAAAELARGSGGFKRLAALPQDLGRDLLRIFQPSPATKPLFGVLLAAIDKSKLKWAKVVAAVVRGAIGWFVLTVAAVLLLALWGLLLVADTPRSWGDWGRLAVRGLPMLVPALLLGLVAAAAGLALSSRRRLAENGYGLCRGSNGKAGTPPRGVEPFTDWLHAKLQHTAGLGHDEVLTFGHLWGDRTAEKPPEDPAIRLEMMTTNLTFCRPVRLPFESDIYYFCKTELVDYFPPAVCKQLVDCSRPSASGNWTCPDHGVPLVHLPHPGQVPVVVAVRMTLSFPVLISAVPLFAIDRAAEPHRPVRCWFSDGGISSNFPIHFFDALWPGRPTFGISLGSYPPGREDRHVYLRRQSGVALPRVRETGSFTAFVAALLDTLQNWSDEGQSILPGYRDRIVEVRHTEQEGGININMTEEQVLRMCWKGWCAGKELERFNFDHHRWARYRTAMAELDKATADMASKYDGDLAGGVAGYRDFVCDLPEGSGDDPGVRWRDKAVTRTDTLLAFAGRQADGTIDEPAPDFPKEEPRPAPTLRVVADF